MERLQCAGNVMRKLALITLAGFLVVFLAGPVLGLVGMLLPFALVGFLVWIPFRLAVMAKKEGWPAVRQTIGRTVRTVVSAPLWLIARVFGAIFGAFRLVFALVGFVLGLTFLTLGGAIGGGALGAIGGMEYHDADVRIPAGAVIGALVGFLFWAMRSKPAKILAVKPVTEHLQHA